MLLRAMFSALSALMLASPLSSPTTDGPPPRTERLANRKSAKETARAPLLGTLVLLHQDLRVILDRDTPTQERFDALLADRVSGESHALAVELLALLRDLAARHPNARIEIVSGYRSEKLNEMLRKKGHHVASHSQHSLGHACDFRVVTDSGDEIEPRALEKEIRDLGWKGGTGVYVSKDDRFVHADVGPERRWNGQ